MVLKIGIISDLHCHQLAKHNEEIEYEKRLGHILEKKKESYIITDSTLPIPQDPYLSFKELIKQQKKNGLNIDVDLLVALGDMGNKGCPVGIKRGWEVVKDMGIMMNAKSIVSTVGNHDVDSRKIFNSDPFHLIQNLDVTFPTTKQLNNKDYWKNGFTIIENEHYNLLLINSVHNHKNEKEAEHGLFSDESMNMLENSLQNIDVSKLGIAICHHCPMEHSRMGSKNTDLMYNGDQLIPLLDQFNFEIIIHGHKHDPMLRYGSGSGDSSIVFSAGSFSGFQDILLPAGGMNTFHVIYININQNSRSTGIIDTWFFVPTKGWKKEVPNPYFKSKVGFGTRIDIKNKAQKIFDWFLSSEKKQLLYLSEFIPYFPELSFLIPIDLERLIIELKRKKILISKGDINEDTRIEFKN
jgi:Predicted phosphohydrolases